MGKEFPAQAAATTVIRAFRRMLRIELTLLETETYGKSHDIIENKG